MWFSIRPFLPLDTPGNLAVEVENVVDLTKIGASVEIVMVIQTSIQNTKGIFFTDSNCYQVRWCSRGEDLGGYWNVHRGNSSGLLEC